MASIGIPCKMLFDDDSLLLLQRYDYLKVIDYSSYSKKEHPTLVTIKVENSKVAKKFVEIGLDVLFSYMLRLENSRTSGCERLEKNTTSGEAPLKGVWGKIRFPHRKGCKTTLRIMISSKQPFLLRFFWFLLRRNF